MPGHQHHRAGGIDRANRPQHLEPGHLGHLQVDEDRIGTQRVNLLQGVGAGAVTDDVEIEVAGETFDERQHARLVVDRQKRRALVDHNRSSLSLSSFV